MIMHIPKITENYGFQPRMLRADADEDALEFQGAAGRATWMTQSAIESSMTDYNTGVKNIVGSTSILSLTHLSKDARTMAERVPLGTRVPRPSMKGELPYRRE